MLACPIIVCHKDDDEMIGTAVSMDIVMMATAITEENPVGITPMAKVGVCWEDQRCPAISIHDPSELKWLDIPEVTDIEDEESENDGDEDSGE